MQVSRSMQRCCAAAKIAPRAVFHDLRRSYGSLLLNAGANAEVTQELLGHADMRMTRRVYAHLAGGSGYDRVRIMTLRDNLGRTT